MKDEIKEILRQIKNVIDYNEIQNIYETANLECEDAKLLLDYITNLQERNEKAIEYINSRINTLNIISYEDIINILQGSDDNE